MTTASTRARLFFAVPVDPPLQGPLAAFAQGIAEATQGRAVPPQNLHVTLAFLGSVHRARLPVVEAAGKALRVTSPIALDLDVLGSFARAGVAWIGPAHVPALLTELQQQLSTALAASGFAAEDRPWRPHVTLARHCRTRVPHEARAAFAWRPEAVVLYESVTAPGGPRYEPLARWPLPVPSRRDGTDRRSTRSTSPDTRG